MSRQEAIVDWAQSLGKGHGRPKVLDGHLTRFSPATKPVLPTTESRIMISTERPFLGSVG